MNRSVRGKYGDENLMNAINYKEQNKTVTIF